MGRKRDGFAIREGRTGIYCVRFTHNGRQHEPSLYTRDFAEAQHRGAQVYADTISGRVEAPTRVLQSTPLADIVDRFIEASPLRQATLRSYASALRVHVVPFFGSLGRIQPETIADWIDARLRKAVRSSVKHDRAALKTFMRWCKRAKLISAVPSFPPMPEGDHGKRQRRGSVTTELAPNDIRRVLAALPECSKLVRGKRLVIRDRFVVAYETSLRPRTIGSISVPEHYTRGSVSLVITDDIDKVRFGRTVPLTDAARAALDAHCPEEGVIFGEHDFARVIKKAAAATLSPRQATTFSQYDFRHNRITHLLEESGNLPGTQQVAGHRRATTTDGYSHPSYRAAEAVLRGGILGASHAASRESHTKEHFGPGRNPTTVDSAGAVTARNHYGRMGAESAPKVAQTGHSRGDPYTSPTLTRRGRLTDAGYLSALGGAA